MFKLFKKYLRVFVLPIVIIIALLIAQAVCDLKLPDFTSKIINVGIQQGGIEYAVPETVRKDQFNGFLSFAADEGDDSFTCVPQKVDKKTFERILLFAENSETKELIENSYTLENGYYIFQKKSDISTELSFPEAAYFVVDSLMKNADLLTDDMLAALKENMPEESGIKQDTFDFNSVLNQLKQGSYEENWKYFESFGAGTIKIASNIIKKEIEQNETADASLIDTAAYIWCMKNAEETGDKSFGVNSVQEHIVESYELKNGIYELKDKSDKNKENLHQIMSKPIAVYSMLDTMINNPDQFKEMMESYAGDSSDSAEKGGIEFDLDIAGIDENVLHFIYASLGLGEDADLMDIVSFLPNTLKTKISNEVSDKLGNLMDTIVDQYSVMWVKSEYTAQGIDVNSIQMNYLFKLGLQMLGVAALIMLAAAVITFLAGKVAAGFGHDVREAVFNKVIGFSGAEFNKFSTASLITRSTNDVQQIQMVLVMLLRMVLYAPIIGIGAVIKIVGVQSSLAWIIAVAVLIVIVTVVILFAVVAPKFAIMQKFVDKLNLVAREVLTGLPVIRAFSTEKYEEKRFDKANIDFTKVNLFANRTMALMMPMITFLMSGLSCAIVWFGSKQVDAGTMQVGNLMAYIQYAIQIMIAFLMVSMVSIMLPRAKAAGDRIQEVLSVKLSVADKTEPQSFGKDKNGVVEFKHVCFAYPGAEEKVLSDISFTASPGKVTAIIGGTGSGKSTIVNLIPRLYDATEGEVLVDGKNVREVTQHALREKIGFVPQKATLFSGTIESNLKYGDNNICDDDMQKGAEIAQAMEFINTKPEKFKHPITQSGTNVSGGQKQRLAIARAIIKDPEILVFDDSFSALDFKTDKKLRAELASKTVGKTVIIVAQRISTIIDADQIIVLDDGRITGIGSHAELMKNCREYQEIALSQLSEEELQNGTSK